MVSESSRSSLGVSLQCQIAVENLECILSLPAKYQRQIEGLIGNYDGLPANDLINRNTNQTIPIRSASSSTSSVSNDTDILAACRSCEFQWNIIEVVVFDPLLTKLLGIADSTTQFPGYQPIIPSELVRWYYEGNNSLILASFNPLLNQTNVNQTCGDNFECIHDFIIRINPVTSGSTRILLADVENSIDALSMSNYSLSSPMSLFTLLIQTWYNPQSRWPIH